MSRSRAATRYAALGVLTFSLALGACGDDSPNDAEFNPTGMSADIQAMGSAYESGTADSYGAAIDAIDGTVGAPALMAPSFRLLRTLPRNGELGALASSSAKQIEAMKELFSRASASNLMSIVIPEEVRGTTFEYNVTSDQYEPTARTGAPTTGIRFVLYAVNPVTGVIVEPLNEIGYVDAIDQSSASTDAVRFLVVSGSTTYFDYGVAFTATATGGTVGVDGFVSNGTTRVNHDITITASEANNGTVNAEFELDVPSRSFQLDYSLDAVNANTANVTLNYDLTARGENGRIGLVGGGTEDDENATFTVNGEPFAVFSSDGTTATITRPDGTPLSAEEAQAAGLVYAVLFFGLSLFLALIAPVASVLPPIL